MRAVLATLLVLAAPGCATRTPAVVQGDYAEKLRPAEVEAAVPAPDAAPRRELRTFTLRIYADADHRAQVRDWEGRVRGIVERANAYLEREIAFRWTIESLRSWDRRSGLEGIEQALRDLEKLDDGAEVDWVLGLVTAVPGFSAAHDGMGGAFTFGRHMVMRSMESVGEVKALERILDLVPPDRRERLYRERREHKETAILLHEFAHTLGAPHERRLETLMSGLYDHRQASFSPEAVSLIELGLAHRANAGTARGRVAWGEAYLKSIAELPSPWTPEERARAVAFAEQVLLGKAPAGPGAGTLSRHDVATFNEAVELLARGEAERAFLLVEPLAAAHPRDERVQTLACAGAVRAQAPSAPARCRAAIESSEGPEARLLLAHALLDAGDRPGAAKALVDGEARIRGGEADDWQYVAWLAQAAATPTLAERAASRIPLSKQGADALEWATRARAVSGLGAGSAVPLEREHEYVDAMTAAEEDAFAGRRERALQRARWAGDTFPGTPAVELARCTIHARGRSSAAAARSACERALKAFPDALHAHRILALLAEQERRWDVAAAHHARALELDGRDQAAWRRLADIHRRRRDDPALDGLRERYQARFGEPLAVEAR